VAGVEVLNVICAYALQVGLTDDIKKVFWEELEEIVQSVTQNEKLFLRRDFHDHIGENIDGYDTTSGGFGFEKRNIGGVAILDFTVTFNLTIVNPFLRRRKIT